MAPSGETAAPHSSPVSGQPVVSRRGKGSATSTTASRVVLSSRSTPITSRASSIQTGDEPSQSRRGTPPVEGTTQTAPSSP